MTEIGPMPGSEEWQGLITASKAPAILGLSNWKSPYATWLQMKGTVGDDTRNLDGKARGHYLENGIIDWWLDQHPGASGERQKWSPLGDWAGANADLAGHDDGEGRRFVLEAKTDAGDLDWADGPPTPYLVQVLFQIWCADAEIGYIAALHPRLKFSEHIVERDDTLIAGIIDRCREFYESLALDEPPVELDDTVATYEAVKRAHPGIDKGSEIQIPAGLAHSYVWATRQEDDALAAARLAKTRVLALMGDANYAVLNGQRIARRQAGPHGSVGLKRATTKIND